MTKQEKENLQMFKVSLIKAKNTCFLKTHLNKEKDKRFYRGKYVAFVQVLNYIDYLFKNEEE